MSCVSSRPATLTDVPEASEQIKGTNFDVQLMSQPFVMSRKGNCSTPWQAKHLCGEAVNRGLSLSFFVPAESGLETEMLLTGVNLTLWEVLCHEGCTRARYSPFSQTVGLLHAVFLKSMKQTKIKNTNKTESLVSLGHIHDTANAAMVQGNICPL